MTYIYINNQKRYQHEKQQADAVALNQLSKASKSDEKKSDKDKKSSSSAQASTSNMSLVGLNATNSYMLVEPKPFDRLLAQSLDLYENCLSLIPLNNTQNEPSQNVTTENTHETDTNVSNKTLIISCDLLSHICAPIVSLKAKSLLLSAIQTMNITSSTTSISNNLATLALYNSHKDKSLLNLISTTFRPVKAEILYDYENLQKCLVVCKSLIQQQRAHNLVKFLTDKFGTSDGFIGALNALFWRVINRCSLSTPALNSIGIVGCSI